MIDGFEVDASYSVLPTAQSISSSALASSSSTSIASLLSPFRFVPLLLLSSVAIHFRPSEPYLTPFLIEEADLGIDVVNEVVYPVYTYAYISLLIPVGLLTTITSYRILITIGFLFHLVTNTLIILSPLPTNYYIFIEISFALSQTIQNCIFYTYIYTVIQAKYYHILTSYLRSVTLLAYVCSAVLGQVMVSAGVKRRDLFIINLTSISLGIVMFVMMQVPANSTEDAADIAPLTAQREDDDDRISLNGHGNQAANDDNALYEPAPPTCAESLSLKTLYHHAHTVLLQYQRYDVVFYSLYIWLGNGVLELVLGYDTTLFYELDSTMDYNGVVLAVGALCAAGAALLPSNTHIHTYVRTHSYTVFTVLPLIAAFTLILSAVSQSIILAYCLFPLYYALMAFLLSFASGAIANAMSIGQFALLFSVNQFISLIIQTIIQAIISGSALALSIQMKYFVFAGQTTIVAITYAILGMKKRMSMIPT